jgi:hypothetical protein
MADEYYLKIASLEIIAYALSIQGYQLVFRTFTNSKDQYTYRFSKERISTEV